MLLRHGFVGAGRFAVIAMAMTGSNAYAATATGKLSVSITIASQCTVRTSNAFDPNAFEQAFLAGMPSNGVSVRCNAAVPFMLRLEQPARRANPAVLNGPAYQTDTTHPRLRELLSPDSPTTLIDTPTRMVIQPISGNPLPTEPPGEEAFGRETPTSGRGPRMIVVTY